MMRLSTATFGASAVAAPPIKVAISDKERSFLDIGHLV